MSLDRRTQDALAGLERWKTRHPRAASHLEPADVLVDAMRGRYSSWTRIRVKLQQVPQQVRSESDTLLYCAMRARCTHWTRVRFNLQHLPQQLRPTQEPLDPDEKIFSSS